jgi:hypothetical protein
MPTQDENREALVREVFAGAPSSLTPQEKLAAVAFAADVLVFEPGHPMDRVIRTSLDDPRFQEHIGVTSAQRVNALARSLAAKGVLERVEDRQTWRFVHLPNRDQERPSDGH